MKLASATQFQLLSGQCIGAQESRQTLAVPAPPGSQPNTAPQQVCRPLHWIFHQWIFPPVLAGSRSWCGEGSEESPIVDHLSVALQGAGGAQNYLFCSLLAVLWDLQLPSSGQAAWCVAGKWNWSSKAEEAVGKRREEKVEGAKLL